MTTHCERIEDRWAAPLARALTLAELCVAALLGGAYPAPARAGHTGASVPGQEFAYCTTAFKGIGRLYQFRIAQDGTLQPLEPPYIALKPWPGSAFTSPSQRFLYVPAAHSILEYRITREGVLKPLSPPSAPGGFEDPVFSRGGRFLYGDDGDTDVIFQFAARRDGQLKPLAPALIHTGHGGCLGPVLSPDGRTLYTRNVDCTIGQYRVGEDGRLSPLTPAAVPAAPSGRGVMVPEMVLGPGGHYAYAVADTFNQMTHTGDKLLTVFRVLRNVTLERLSSRAIPPMGDLQVRGRTLLARLGLGHIDQYRIAADGQLVAGTQIHGPSNGSAFAFSPSGRYAYQVSRDGARIHCYRCQPDGSLTPLPSGPVVPGMGGPFGVYIDLSGRFLYTGTASNWGGAAIGQFKIGEDGQVTPLHPRSVSMPMNGSLVIVRLPAPPAKLAPNAKGKRGTKHKPALKTKGKARARRGAGKR